MLEKRRLLGRFNSPRAPSVLLTSQRFRILCRVAVDVARPGRAIIIDTKFYAQALKVGAYGTAKLPSTNLYQLFTYLRQQGWKPGWEKAQGVLLYPRTTQHFDAVFTTHGHRIRALTVDLFQPWQSIHDALMRIATVDAAA